MIPSKRGARGTGRPLNPATPTGIADLGPELLNAIFTKLAPSPVYLAALSCVCKEWRNVMQEQTWKQLCLEAAPGLCKAMGYSRICIRPGGWAAAFQLLLYCPGLPSVLYTTARGAWWDLLGHVEKNPSGFQTGDGVASALQLKEAFHGDVLFVSGWCQHEGMRAEEWDVDMDYFPSFKSCACRGLVQNFPESAIAERSGAVKFCRAPLEEQQRIQERAKDQCAYCRAPLFELQERLFFKNSYCSSEYALEDEEEEEDSDWEEPDEDGSAVRGHICGNGHLLLGAVGNYSELGGKTVAGSGEGLTVETSSLLKELSETFALQEEFENELVFRKGLDAFSVTRKLRCLARGIRDGVFAGDHGELEEGEEARFSVESKTKAEVNALLAGFLTWAWDTATAFEEDSANSETETEPDVQAGGNSRFWDIPTDDLDFILRSLEGHHRAVPIVRWYASGSKRSAKTVLRRWHRVRMLERRRSDTMSALRAIRDKRKAEIEAALKKVGIHPAGEWAREKWPDTGAVDKYASVSG